MRVRPPHGSPWSSPPVPPSHDLFPCAGSSRSMIHSATQIEIVTDRNVHDRLILAVGAAYADWTARRAPGANALSLTLAGTPVLLGDAGAFDATVPLPVSGHATLIVTTAAGEATAREVP